MTSAVLHDWKELTCIKCAVCPRQMRTFRRPDGVVLCKHHLDAPQVDIDFHRGSKALADAIRLTSAKLQWEEAVDGLGPGARGTVANYAAHNWHIARVGNDCVVTCHEGDSFIITQDGKSIPTQTPHACATCQHWHFNRTKMPPRDPNAEPSLCGYWTEGTDYPAINGKKLRTVPSWSCSKWAGKSDTRS